MLLHIAPAAASRPPPIRYPFAKAATLIRVGRLLTARIARIGNDSAGVAEARREFADHAETFASSLSGLTSA
jgi:hypothetical protein